MTPMSMSMSIPIAICADDFAQHGGIDDAVCALLAQRRLSAVSCMCGAPRWLEQSAPRLREQGDGADLGLHLNLTEGFGESQDGEAIQRLPMLIVRSYCRRLDQTRLYDIIARQLDAFEAGIGKIPDFVDGHQHIHQLPMVRQVLLKILQTRYPGALPWVRNTLPANRKWRGKALLLRLLGGAALAQDLTAARIPSNHGFAGVYGFDTEDYAARFETWLQSAGSGTLLMCHPGQADEPNDPIGKQRLVEYAFLGSERFINMLATYRVRVERLSALLRKEHIFCA